MFFIFTAWVPCRFADSEAARLRYFSKSALVPVKAVSSNDNVRICSSASYTPFSSEELPALVYSLNLFCSLSLSDTSLSSGGIFREYLNSGFIYVFQEAVGSGAGVGKKVGVDFETTGACLGLKFRVRYVPPPTIKIRKATINNIILVGRKDLAGGVVDVAD